MTKRKTKLKKINILLMFVVLPIAILSLAVIATYNSNKISPFEDYEYTKNDITSFDYDLYATQINYETTSYNVFKVSVTINNKANNIIVNSLYCRIIVGSNWDGQMSSTGSTYCGTLDEADDELTKTVTIYSYDLTYPSTAFLFFKVTKPKLYVLFEWEEQANASADSETKCHLVKLSYNDYYINGTTIGSITNA